MHFQSLYQRFKITHRSLKSSLHHFSISSHYSPPPSLRDLAVRVIQTHFCAFLVHRSRTLRHLKELALIKSAFNSLKSSTSSETHFDYDTLSHKAMDLLLKLDYIQVNHSWLFRGVQPTHQPAKTDPTHQVGLVFRAWWVGLGYKKNFNSKSDWVWIIKLQTCQTQPNPPYLIYI